MGRPKQTINRNERIYLRLTPLEKKVVVLAAKEANLSISDFTRRAALNMKVTIRFSPKELDIYNDLHKYHQNFTRISNLLRGNEFKKEIKVIKEIEEVKYLIKMHLKRFEV